MSAQPAQFSLPFTHYASLGYSPCPTAGKVPSQGVGWYEYQYTPQQYELLDTSSCNVGLRCSNVVGLDIDVPDAALAAKVEAVCRKVLKLPKSTPIRVGSAPKRLLVARVNAPTRGWDIKVPGRTLFQLLGAGKQFVIHGTHPDTHKPYTLSAPLPKQSSLRLVDESTLGSLKLALLDLFESEGHPVRADGATGKKGTGQWSQFNPWTEQGMKLAVEALYALDPDMAMNDWVKIGFAIHDGTHGSDEGLNLWIEWSSGGEKYKVGDCARRWRGFESGGATTAATLFKNDFPKVAGSRHEPATVFSAPVSMDAGELFDFEAGGVPWVIEEMATHGAHLLAGRPKGGKSWVTMDMAYGVGSGGTFMGARCARGRVLWIAAEDTKASLSRRLKVRGERPQNISVMTMESLGAEAKKYPDITFDAWLRKYLEENGDVSLVIMDTHATIEARWQNEEIEDKRRVSPVELAYQKSRIYEDIGHGTSTCIILVHHTGKLKNNHDLDYHERINMPATVVAGATASFVLADLPDRDQHDEDNHRRIFALRGRHLLKDTPQLIEMKDGRILQLGDYAEVRQTEAQCRVFETIEAILMEQEQTTMGEVAKSVGMTLRNVAGLLGRCKRDGKLGWKGRTLVIRAGRGGGLSWM